MMHPREFGVPEDDMLDHTPLGGLAGCLVALLLAVAVVLPLATLWVWLLWAR